MSRVPVVFACHGAGPLPVIGNSGADQIMASHLRSLPKHVSQAPKAILVVSAHWESSPVSVTSSKTPQLLYDYYGFPPAAYDLQYPCAGSPDLACRVSSVLSDAGIPCTLDDTRGLDHGVFVPLLLAYPDADIPVLELSIDASLDAKKNMSLGEAISCLRDEGVLILCSGMTFHNMSFFMGPKAARAEASAAVGSEFNTDLKRAMQLRGAEREQAISKWTRFREARLAHPREEHLVPLFVAVGAAGEDAGSIIFDTEIMGAACSAYVFGKPDEA